MQKQAAKIAGIVFLLIVLIVVGDIITGAVSTRAASPLSITSCNNPASLEQCGTASCTISATSLPGQQACSTIVTFPVAFSAIPKYVSAQWAGIDEQHNHAEKAIPLFSTYFESDNSETWAAFPVASTELYGDVNHETSIEAGAAASSAIEASFFVTCTAQAGVQTGTETLRPQFLDPNTGLWNELAANTGTLDIPVGGIFCGVSGSEAENVGPSAIAQTFFTDSATQLRVVGFGGGGAGDSMTFNEIYLLFYGDFLNTPSICIQVTTQCPVGVTPTNLPLSNTKMIIAVEIPFPHPTSSFQVNMIWMAEE